MLLLCGGEWGDACPDLAGRGGEGDWVLQVVEDSKGLGRVEGCIKFKAAKDDTECLGRAEA